MRIELLYAPGCLDYKKALHKLEYIIAEERLPLPVELVEDSVCGAPAVRIDGELIGQRSTSCLEHIREIVQRKWTELTLSPLKS